MRNHLVSREKLAHALNVLPEHFDTYIARLAHLNFPGPATEDGNHWAVAEILDWVLERHESLATVLTHISDWLETKDR